MAADQSDLLVLTDSPDPEQEVVVNVTEIEVKEVQKDELKEALEEKEKTLEQKNEDEEVKKKKHKHHHHNTKAVDSVVEPRKRKQNTVIQKVVQIF